MMNTHASRVVVDTSIATPTPAARAIVLIRPQVRGRIRRGGKKTTPTRGGA